MSGLNKVLLVPCSGIGKVHGLIAREAVLRALEETGKDKTDTICLSLLVTSDEDALREVRSNPCIAIDGCPKLCARKNLELAAANICDNIRVVDAFRNHRGAKPGNGTKLTEEGWAITEEIARDLTNKVNQLLTVEKGK
jgi:uncharacterized metal-binding protein